MDGFTAFLEVVVLLFIPLFLYEECSELRKVTLANV